MFRFKLFLVFLIPIFALLFIPFGMVNASLNAKYIFLFIGDGMGFPQVKLAEAFYGSLTMCNLKVKGEVATYAANKEVPDSAASATALATGYKTLNGILSMDPLKTEKLKTIAYMAKERGMKVGIITNTPLDDATPAAFYSNQPSRLNYYEISLDLISSGFDYFVGGRPLGNSDRYRKGKPDILKLAEKKGYSIIKGERELKSLKSNKNKVIVLDQAPTLYYEIDRPLGSLSLADLLRIGIECLYGSSGFLMIVEGGKIDWACHANDAMTAIAEVKSFDEAIKVALDFYNKHPRETLIVVTADHETGGMELDLSEKKYKYLAFQKVSYAKFNMELFRLKSKPYDKRRLYSLIENCFGFTISEREANLLEEDERKLTFKLIRILNEKAGIKWKTAGHTATSVPIFAHGVGAELFEGFIDNTDVAKNIMRIAGLVF
ncbi:MAG: alkaline phosphatase [Synergistetes bacterium]|nr:alkaline phosphatase [Synergistota bacterium]